MVAAVADGLSAQQRYELELQQWVESQGAAGELDADDDEREWVGEEAAQLMQVYQVATCDERDPSPEAWWAGSHNPGDHDTLDLTRTAAGDTVSEFPLFDFPEEVFPSLEEECSARWGYGFSQSCLLRGLQEPCQPFHSSFCDELPFDF